MANGGGQWATLSLQSELPAEPINGTYHLGVSRPDLDLVDLPDPEEAFGVSRMGFVQVIKFTIGPSLIALEALCDQDAEELSTNWQPSGQEEIGQALMNPDHSGSRSSFDLLTAAQSGSGSKSQDVMLIT
jgi:hypothetical protein